MDPMTFKRVTTVLCELLGTCFDSLVSVVVY